jgi:hypothetical protein
MSRRSGGMEHWLGILMGAGAAPGVAYVVRSIVRSMVDWRRETRIREASAAVLHARSNGDRDAAFRVLCKLLDREDEQSSSPPAKPPLSEGPKDPPMAGIDG